MTIEEILKLGEMGYTKADIEAMGKEEPEKEEPKKEEPKKEEPKKEEEPAPDPTKDLLEFMAGEFEKLNKSIQDANILGSNIKIPEKKTAEEVLVELIDPPKKKEEK